MSGDTVAAPICTDSEAVDLDALMQQAVIADFDVSAYASGSPDYSARIEAWVRARMAMVRAVPALIAELRTLRAQPSATLGGVTVTAAMVRAARKAGHDHEFVWGMDQEQFEADHLTAALSLQNATPDATRARETGE